MTTRRRFIIASLAASAIARSPHAAESKAPVSIESLDRILAQPVIRTERLKAPVIITSVDLLRMKTGEHVLRMRSKDGVEAFSMPNPGKIAVTQAVLLKNVAPFFIGKDARQIETLLWEVYRQSSNYKMQGLIFWAAVATVEMAVLELLAQTAAVPLAELFGSTLRRDIPVYFASSNRGNTPADELKHLQSLVGSSGVKAIKWRAGGRMSRNADSPPGRTETLVPLLRREFGDEMILHADSNSSYDAAEGIRIGRLMEEQRYGFFEEPCEFDDLWGTKQVTDALTMPVAGGEQEYSMHRWKWMIANRAVDIVQPDLHYGGGFIRATQVARMAASAGMTVVPHMSGGGLGYVEVVQFASFTPNIGTHMEFKGNASLPVEAADSTLVCRDGIVRCPAGVGFGIRFDPAFLAGGSAVKL